MDSWLANAGDGAISIATERLIRSVVPEASVLHGAYQSDLVEGHYPGLRFVPPLDALLGVVPEVPEARGWSEREMTALVAQADVVLSQGGGFLIERYEPWQRLDAYERLGELGIPLGFIAQTIGRFEREDKRASLSRALRRAAVVGVRDRRSLENVVALGVPEAQVRLAADQAFSLFSSPPVPRERRGVAMVVSPHTLMGADRYVSDDPNLRPALVETLRLVSEAVHPEPLTLLSTNQGLGPRERGLEDDDLFADEIVAAMPAALRRRIRRVRGYLAPLECARLIGNHRVLVSMRMHPVIFSLCQGVPAVAITRAHKAIDLLSDLGMDDVAVRWLDPQSTADAVRRTLEPDAPRETGLWRRLEQARERESVNRDALLELLETVDGRA